MRSIVDYSGIIGDEAIAEIFKVARKLRKRHILQINSTYQGGGVAELLSALVPLFNDAGISCGWRILHGNPDFFTVTKKFHNALQGEKINLSAIKKQLYIETNRDFSQFTHINHDCVIIHDPQPLALIKYYKTQQPWIWRCHIDLSHPDKEIWTYLKQFILSYDVVVISSEKYRQKELPLEQVVIPPAIDPLSIKNKEIDEKYAVKFLQKFNIPLDKPLITQVSRFDKWKDPTGVVEVFKKVKEEVDCRLVLCGNMATDDPEGQEIFQKVYRQAKDLIEKNEVILIMHDNNVLVNILQRLSAVVVQKSLKEGFGLTVTEAMWKGKPVVASDVGGISLQIRDGENGFIIEPNDGDKFAERIIQILRDPELAVHLGKNAKEAVRKKFLITRLMLDYLKLFSKVLE